MQRYYLLTELIEFIGEEAFDNHKLYDNLGMAKAAMAIAREKAAESFSDDCGDFLIDLDTIVEWRNENGEGYTIGIQELTIEQSPS